MKYHKSIIISSVFTIMMLTFHSCKDKAEDKTEAAVEVTHHKEKSSVTLTQKQFNSINVQLGNIEEKNLTGTLRASGYLKVPPQNKANITSPLGGTVYSILVKEGDIVSKGQTLASLVNIEFIKMQQDFLETNSQLTFASAELNRQKDLSEGNVSALKVYQRSVADYNVLKARHSSLKKQLLVLNIDTESLNAENILSALSIKSPINGSVSHITINIGKTVQPSDEIMDVVDNSQLHIDMFVFEQDLGKIKIGQNVDVILTNMPGKHYTAKIFSIGSAFEGSSKSIPIHATVTGSKTDLIEGMNIAANIAIGSNSSSSIPESAIISFAGSDYIFVQAVQEEEEHSHVEGEAHTHDNHSDGFTFQRIQIKRGITENGFTEITPLQELPGDAKVVINGSYYLMSMLTNEGEHEH